MNQTTKNNNPIELEITQEQLFDFLYHAATREDIDTLRSDIKQDTIALRNEFREDITALRSELKADIAALRSELKEDIAQVKSEITELRNGQNKIMWFILASILAPILMRIFHF